MAGRETGTFVPRTETAFKSPVPAIENKLIIFHGLKFTQRRIDILTLTAQGLSRKQIAEMLSLSIHTIDSHATSISSAFGTSNLFWPVIETARISIIDIPKPTIAMDEQTQEKLSNREHETLESLTNGRDIEETASFLNVTPYAVNARLKSAHEKLGFKKSSQKGLDNLGLALIYLDAKKSGTLLPREYLSLSQKKRQIFKLITSGHSTKQISEILKTKMKTISSFRYLIIEFLKASGFTEFLIKLVDKKLLDPNKYIENVKKLNDNFLTNVDPENISSLLSKMSKEELDVLDTFVTGDKKGGQNKEIAEPLRTSKFIVVGRMREISKKLGRAKREHIAMWYLAATSPPQPDPTNSTD